MFAKSKGDGVAASAEFQKMLEQKGMLGILRLLRWLIF